MNNAHTTNTTNPLQNIGTPTHPTPPPLILSKKSQKKLKKKQQKQQEKLQRKQHAQDELLKLSDCQDSVPSATHAAATHTFPGKAGRAKAARLGRVLPPTSTLQQSWRERLFSNATVEQRQIIHVLENLESSLRQRFHPRLIQRATIPVDIHGDLDPEIVDPSTQQDTFLLSLRSQRLRIFSLDDPLSINCHHHIQTLDLSRNELWGNLPALLSMTSLTSLNLARNFFQQIPPEIGQLTRLISLDITHNMLSGTNVDVQPLQCLEDFTALDISFNSKCCKKSLHAHLTTLLPQVALKMTIPWWDGKQQPAGTYVGNSAADRDATLLRSQLEPWSTTALRRRLIVDFGQMAATVATVERSDVMGQLLACYLKEGLMRSQKEPQQETKTTRASSASTDIVDIETTTSGRTLVRVQGTPVSAGIRAKILNVLREWSSTGLSSGSTRERPSIQASSYMILRSPAHMLQLGKKTIKELEKFQTHEKIWTLAMAALKQVDSEFAARVTALAVTHNFTGSPHIDKQNIGPFYGMSLGNFEEGQGGVRVECSARVVCEINTKNRMGKVDGRYPHWVSPYNQKCERYSLIFYRTSGVRDPVGPAIFSVPGF